MRLRFDPVRFIGQILLASLGSGLGTALTFVVAWQLSGNAASHSVGVLSTALVVGLIASLPLILPAAIAVVVVAWLIRLRLPVVEPGGWGMTLLLGSLGILLQVLLALLIDIPGRGEVGSYLLLSAGIGGALCGTITSWRMKV